MQDLASVIDKAFENRAELDASNASSEIREAVDECLARLDSGALRVAEPVADGWQVNEWAKKAVLLSFKLSQNQVIAGGHTNYFDKVPMKFAAMQQQAFEDIGARVVPPASVRRGCFIGANVILMPSYVNIGAYVDSGTMVDTWATVGSCAQIGRNVHLSGGVGIGGVLEPPNAVPVMIGDDCLIGSRCIVAEGARVGDGVVLGAGAVLTGSIPVIDAATGEELGRGVVPAWCVAVQAIRTKVFDGGEFGLPCVLVLKYLEPGERHDKSALNDVLRTHGVST